MGDIFVITEGGRLEALEQRAYDSEDRLQTLLAEYPNLLAGGQINPQSPRRWLFISREVGVPGEEGGNGRWSLDHLFLDQDAVPTFVEVKRSTDTRTRREVVGQMLDYAANALEYWPVDAIRGFFERRCGQCGADAEEALQQFLGPEADGEEYWERVKTNLQAGRVRLLFVADELPLELKRIIEFLNEQREPAEVLGIEIRQFTNDRLQTLVPQVVGLTAEAERRKNVSGEKKQWDEISFFEEMAAHRTAEECSAAREVLEWANPRVTRIWWGRGSQMPSFIPVLEHGGRSHQVLAVYTWDRSSSLEVHFQYYRNKPPFDDPERRRQLLRRLNEIDGISLPEDSNRSAPKHTAGDAGSRRSAGAVSGGDAVVSGRGEAEVAYNPPEEL